MKFHMKHGSFYIKEGKNKNIIHVKQGKYQPILTLINFDFYFN